MALFDEPHLLLDVARTEGGLLVGRITLDASGCILIDDAIGTAVVQLTPEHAYYLADMLTKWADAQEMEDNS